jgi:hypothetical protein
VNERSRATVIGVEAGWIRGAADFPVDAGRPPNGGSHDDNHPTWL